MIGKRFFIGLLLAFALPIGVRAQPARSKTPAQVQARPQVYTITFKDIVSRATADYVIRAVEESSQKKGSCLVILLDTPGGELEATRSIVQALLGSGIPVVVYVHPAGARAGSAGVFITMAAHIAAMSPGTNIGAAHPVGGQGENIEGDLRKKLEQDTAAFIRAIAKQRKRNAEWGEKAVLESVSISDSEAVQKRVVDLVAPDLQSLLNRIHGRKVHVAGDSYVILRTKDALLIEIKKSWREWLLSVLANPNVFYILVLLAFYGLIGELQNPGATLPGVVGVISLLLVLYAASVLPINALGVAMILLAFVLFVIDLFSPTHGVLTAGAIISFLIGSLILFQSDSPVMQVSLWLVGSMTVLTGGFFALMTYSGLRAQFRRKESGAERLLGQLAEVRTDVAPVGIVFVDGALWKAITLDEPIKAGEWASVERTKGLTLYVRKAQLPPLPQPAAQPKLSTTEPPPALPGSSQGEG